MPRMKILIAAASKDILEFHVRNYDGPIITEEFAHLRFCAGRQSCDARGLTAPAHQRRIYDHRLREYVCRTGVRSPNRLEIPRSTIVFTGIDEPRGRTLRWRDGTTKAVHISPTRVRPYSLGRQKPPTSMESPVRIERRTPGSARGVRKPRWETPV